jgi:diguanylate cyclase (GGDEF)-like protein
VQPMEEINHLSLAIIDDSTTDAETYADLIRKQGIAVESLQIAGEEVLPTPGELNNIDLILFNKDHSHKSLQQLIELANEQSPPIPVIVLIETYQRDIALDFIDQGANDVIAIDELSHLTDSIVSLTEQHQAAKKNNSLLVQQQEKEQLWLSLLSVADTPIAYLSQGIITYCNKGFETSVGENDITGTPILDYVDPDTVERLRPLFRDLIDRQLDKDVYVDIVFSADKQKTPIRARISSCSMDNENAVQLVLQTATNERTFSSKRSSDHKLNYINIENFQEDLQSAILLAKETSVAGFVGLIEIDDFQDIKDSLGLSISDQILNEIASFISEKLAQSAKLSRLSSGAYIVLINTIGEQQAITLMEQFRMSLAGHTITAGGQGLRLTCSIGLAEVSDKSESGDELIAHADAACRAARKLGGNHTHLFDPFKDYNLAQDTDLEWKSAITDALNQNNFRLLLQPIVNIKDQGRRFQYEVFIRMLDENSNDILPSQFLYAAQQAGIEHLIDKWVVLNSLQMLNTHLGDPEPIQLFIKLSAQTIQDNTFPIWLQSMFETINIGKHSLIFEFDADTCKKSIPRLRTLLPELKQMNQGICIEHFGKDKLHFKVLEDLHFDYLKIDGALVTHLIHDRRNQLTIKKVADKCKQLGITVIAASVQDAAAVSHLWQSGVTQIQGYYVQPPQEGLDYDFSASV